ncbi:MAG: DNA/RNA-binding winged helix domain-containing protein [Caldilineaceae bacterium]
MWRPDRYILRQPSPSATLGGGVVLSPQPRRRWRRFDASVLERFKTLARAPDEILLQTLARTLTLTPAELMGQSGLDLEIAQDALNELTAAGAIFALAMGNDAMLLALEAWEGLLEQTRQILAAFHAQSPLRQGMARGELRSRLQSAHPAAVLSVRFVNALIEEAQKAEIINADDNLVWLHDFQVNLTLHQQAMIDELLAAFAAASMRHPMRRRACAPWVTVKNCSIICWRVGKWCGWAAAFFFAKATLTPCASRLLTLRANGSITLAQARDPLPNQPQICASAPGRAGHPAHYPP